MSLIIALFAVILLIFFYFGLYTLASIVFVIFSLLIFIYFIFYFREMYNVLVKNNAPYIKTSNKLIKRILKDIDFKPGLTVIELGCGDGTFLRKLMNQVEVKGIGYEYYIYPYLLARIYNLFSNKKPKFIYGDFFKEDLSQADYIFCYLLTEQMSKLKKKLEKELKPGTIIISNTFRLKDWPKINEIVIDESKKAGLSNRVYIYKKE